MKQKIKDYFWRNLISFDQSLNTLTGGYPDMTLSARIWRKSQSSSKFWKALRVIVDILFIWQCPNHCESSFESEILRLHYPSYMRDLCKDCPQLQNLYLDRSFELDPDPEA